MSRSSPQEPRILSQMCMEAILDDVAVLQTAVEQLPSRLHAMLFTAAITAPPERLDHLRESLVSIVTSWKQESFRMADFLSQSPGGDLHTHQLLHEAGSGRLSLVEMIVEGFLGLKASSPLRTIDFSDIVAPAIFQLPLLSLPRNEMFSDAVLDRVEKTYKKYVTNFDGTFDSILSWKLDQLYHSPIKCDLKTTGPIDVYTDCRVDISELLSMDDVILGLAVQDMGPFNIKICKLDVNNYHQREAHSFRWLISNVDQQALRNLAIFGKRKSVGLLFWDLYDDLKQLRHLEVFSLATSGPKMNSLGEDDPAPSAILSRTVAVLGGWERLQEVYLSHIILTGQLSHWLGALKLPLTKLSLYNTGLDADDMTYLSECRHLATITELAIQHNDLRGLGHELSALVSRAGALRQLHLKETQLMLHEKAAVMTALASPHVRVVVMHEDEDMISTSGYETLVQLACAVASLREFYVFPFNYRPFEIFYRRAVQEATQEILAAHDRTNLQLYY